MRRLAVALTAASLALLALMSAFQSSGIGGGVVGEGVASAVAAADTVTVDITEDGFAPATVTVPAGGTVSWTNRDSEAHSVVGEPGSGLESPAFDRWGIYSRTFQTAGTIAYHDGLHPELTGIINVVDGDETSLAPVAPESKEDFTPPAREISSPTESSPSSIAGLVMIEAGSDWFGNSGSQNGVYEITIQAGDTVQWNVVEAVHTVYECGDGWSGANTCTNAAWNSDILSAGDTFSHQFNTAGTYAYLCTLHPLTMRGSITVQGSALAADNPPAPAAPVTGPSTDPALAPDSGPNTVPNAGFGPPTATSGPGDYFPLSVVVMAAAGLTFLGSSVMLIKQRMRGAPSVAAGGWTPSMLEPPRFRQETADSQPTTAASGARSQARVPKLRRWRIEVTSETAGLTGVRPTQARSMEERAARKAAER